MVLFWLSIWNFFSYFRYKSCQIYFTNILFYSFINFIFERYLLKGRSFNFNKFWVTTFYLYGFSFCVISKKCLPISSYKIFCYDFFLEYSGFWVLHLNSVTYHWANFYVWCKIFLFCLLFLLFFPLGDRYPILLEQRLKRLSILNCVGFINLSKVI